MRQCIDGKYALCINLFRTNFLERVQFGTEVLIEWWRNGYEKELHFSQEG